MIVGSVHFDEAILPIAVRGRSGAIVQIDAVLDTGFTDWLTLSADQIAQLNLHFREAGRFALADGSQSYCRLYEADVNWLGRWRRILVVEMEGAPLLGMAMLQGSHLEMDVTDNGKVDVSPLNEP